MSHFLENALMMLDMTQCFSAHGEDNLRER
jgi:hypothetical protein